MLKKIGTSVMVVAVVVSGAVMAGDEKKMPNCIKDAKKGEWVLFGMPNNIQQKQTVLEVTKEEVKVKYETIMNGKTLASNEVKIPLKPKEGQEKPKDAPKPKISKEKITVTINGKEKEIECTVVEMKVQGKTTKSYFSNEVPVSGLVKTMMDDTAAMTLKECGTK